MQTAIDHVTTSTGGRRRQIRLITTLFAGAAIIATLALSSIAQTGDRATGLSASAAAHFGDGGLAADDPSDPGWNPVPDPSVDTPTNPSWSTQSDPGWNVSPGWDFQLPPEN